MKSASELQPILSQQFQQDQLWLQIRLETALAADKTRNSSGCR